MEEIKTDKLPLDARLLTRAIIEMNIARRVISLYPGKHELVHISLDKAFDSLQELFEQRPQISLSVAKDALHIDEYYLERRNPVFREFALALSKMNVAVITFVKGMTREEVYTLHRFLCSDTAGLSAEGLRQRLEEQALRHIQVNLVDFTRFAFHEGRTGKGDDVDLMEQYVKALIDGTLMPGDVEQMVAGAQPEHLAEALNRLRQAPERTETYDQVISSYLRGAGQSYTGKELERLFEFINHLRPDLKKEFLSASAKPLGGDLAALQRALEEVSVDSVLSLLAGINESTAAIPKALQDLLTKFSQLGAAFQGGTTGAVDSRADDLLLSPELMNLLREGDGARLNPTSYREEIRHLIDVTIATAPQSLRAAAEAGWEEQLLRFSYDQALMEIVSSTDPDVIPAADQAHFVELLNAMADDMTREGQYGQLHDTLAQLESDLARQRHPQIAGAVLAHCDSDEFLASLVASFRTRGRESRVAATLIADRFGERIVGPLYALLCDEASRSVRRFLLELLAHLGNLARAESLDRLNDGRWFVRRNALCVLGEIGAPGAFGLIERCCRDPDPRVSLEAARCLIKAGHERGVAELRQMVHAPDPAVSGPAMAAAGWLRVRALAPDLIRILERGVRRASDCQAKIPAVRALARIGDPGAEKPLRAILALSRPFRGAELSQLKEEAQRALQALQRALSRQEAPSAPGEPEPDDA